MKHVILLECFNSNSNSTQLYSLKVNFCFEDSVKLAAKMINNLPYLNRIMIITENQFDNFSFKVLSNYFTSVFIGNESYDCSLLEYNEISKADSSILFHSYGKHYFSTNEMVYLVMNNVADDANRIFFFDNENEMKEFFTNTVKNVSLTKRKGEIIMSKIKKSHLNGLIKWQDRSFRYDDYGLIAEKCFNFGMTNYFNFYNEKMNQ